ncbi:hypothetical protein SanaruYs_08890 [Chryseotalea sanaruensis]|uniref:Lipoprotein n=1 Tax=Chryseotalea sanaruensis TaxID=2482724 RepID=A0A401U6W1_9BACT|nr:hypothetical protein [Chryseotalea sanaruensis]GCC50671.1 hypothetical protein SanaruYs_08890 [Chryseotalea sanaruensis]
MKRIIVLLILATLIIGCATIKHDSIQTVDKLNESDFRQLNGRYSNKADDGKGKEFWTQFTGDYQLKTLWENVNQDQFGLGYDLDNQSVSIEFLTSKKAIFKLYQGDSIISEKNVKGKFKDGYFYKRPFFVTIPLVPVLFGYNTNRLRIGKADNAIVADYKWNIWMSFLVAGKAEKGYSSLIFSKR